MIALREFPVQLPLIHIVESDDIYIKEQADVLWYRVLRNLRWQTFVGVGAQYYEALWAFNQAQADARRQKADAEPEVNSETREEADRRLLFGRATLDVTVPVLHETVRASASSWSVLQVPA